MLEPFQILLQQDLALLCQSHRIESLSMRDRETGMLNHYGFIMMAPSSSISAAASVLIQALFFSS